MIAISIYNIVWWSLLDYALTVLLSVMTVARFGIGVEIREGILGNRVIVVWVVIGV